MLGVDEFDSTGERCYLNYGPGVEVRCGSWCIGWDFVWISATSPGHFVPAICIRRIQSNDRRSTGNATSVVQLAASQLMWWLVTRNCDIEISAINSSTVLDAPPKAQYSVFDLWLGFVVDIVAYEELD